MGIKVRLEDNLYCPQVFCDYCGDRITSGGLYEYEIGADCKPVDGQVYFVHAGRCCRAFRAEHGADGYGERIWYDNPLSDLLKWLSFSLGQAK